MTLIEERILAAEDSGNMGVIMYYITEEYIDVDDVPEKVLRYGIKAELGKESEWVHDVTGNRDEAIDIIKKLADNTVTPISLRDIIYDMLYSKEISGN